MTMETEAATTTRADGMKKEAFTCAACDQTFFNPLTAGGYSLWWTIGGTAKPERAYEPTAVVMCRPCADRYAYACSQHGGDLLLADWLFNVKARRDFQKKEGLTPEP